MSSKNFTIFFLARESKLWLLEEKQLQEKNHIALQQVRDRYEIQRRHLQLRHGKVDEACFAI